MVVNCGLFILILTTLVVRSSSPITRQCFPYGFLHFQPLMHFKNPENTGLLWMYALYIPPSPKKLRRVQMLLRTRFLILIMLLTGCVESNPGEFICILFLLVKTVMLKLKRTKVSERCCLILNAVQLESLFLKCQSK